MSRPFLIEIKSLFKIFGNEPERALSLIEAGESKQEILEDTGLTVGLKDINLQIKQGEIFVIMGLSGSGKSTMVRCLSRLVEACLPAGFNVNHSNAWGMSKC